MMSSLSFIDKATVCLFNLNTDELSADFHLTGVILGRFHNMQQTISKECFERRSHFSFYS